MRSIAIQGTALDKVLPHMSICNIHLLSAKVAVSWLKIVGLGLAILSHETATLPVIVPTVHFDFKLNYGPQKR